MPKAYAAPAAFSLQPYVHIPLTAVESTQVAAVGYDEARKTLAVTFEHGIGSIYHYPNVEPTLHAEFMAAPSKGKFFGKRIKQLPFEKFPASVAA